MSMPMSEKNDAQRDALRPDEVAVAPPSAEDAGLVFIGRIHTPWRSRDACPRQGVHDGPECRVEIFEPWVEALRGLEAYAQIELFYWLDRARRDLVVQNPGRDGKLFGTFALRSPVRPNPIGLSRVRLIGVEGAELRVRGLDCLDGTPLIDVKPDRCAFSPKAAPKADADDAS